MYRMQFTSYVPEYVPAVATVPLIKSVFKRKHINLPNKARIYAISDIHGCSDVLEQSLDLICDHLEKNPVDRGTKIFLLTLGDLIDKGPDTYAVLERLKRFPMQWIPLMGNHEKGLIDFLNGPQDGDGQAWLEQARQWLGFGKGSATLKSYGLDVSSLEGILKLAKKEICEEDQEDSFNNHRTDFRSVLEKTGHIQYFEQLRGTASWRHFIFCHAQIFPDRRLSDHTLADVISGRNIVDYSGAFPDGVVVVHGHTNRGEKPILNNYSIGIDPAALQTGKPLVLALESTTQVEILTPEKTTVHEYKRGPKTNLIEKYIMEKPGTSSIHIMLDAKKIAAANCARGAIAEKTVATGLSKKEKKEIKNRLRGIDESERRRRSLYKRMAQQYLAAAHG